MSIEEIKKVLDDKRLTWSTSTGVWIDYAEELIEEIEGMESDLRKLVYKWREMAKEAEDSDAPYASHLYGCADDLETITNNS